MSESRQKTKQGRFDSPYQRVGLLAVGIVVAVGLIFAINFIVSSLGGNERRLADAIFATLKEPRINGQLSLAQQAQTNTFDAKGTFSIDKLQKASLKGEVNGTFQGETLKIPVELFGNFTNNTTYVRVENAPKLANAIGGSAPTIKPDLDSIAAKINSKWLRISQADNKGNTCTTQLFKKIASDENVARDVTGIYAGNRFMTVAKMEDKGADTQEYTVDYNADAMGSFIKTLKTKDYFKAIKACEDSYDPLGTEAAAQQPQQAKNQQTPEAKTTTKLTVKNGRLASLVAVSSLNNQINTTRLSFDYKPGQPLKAPTESIVDSSEIQSEMASLGRIVQQAQQQQQQQQQSSALGPQMQQQIPQ